MQIVCVLKAGPEYGPEHVFALVDSILEHNMDAQVQCLTDVPFDHPRVTCVPLVHRWRGWWSKLELFRPGVCDGPMLYLDLDTVVTGSLAGLELEAFTMLPNVYRPGDYGSGIMAWREAPHHVYHAFCRRPGDYMAQYRTTAKWGDQGFIRDHLGFKPRTFGAEFRSYKVHCRERVPAGTKAVYFHGTPRPWEVELCL